VAAAINASGSSVRGGGFRDRAAPVEVGRDVGARECAKGQLQGL
jgi:hypothetical protein